MRTGQHLTVTLRQSRVLLRASTIRRRRRRAATRPPRRRRGGRAAPVLATAPASPPWPRAAAAAPAPRDRPRSPAAPRELGRRPWPRATSTSSSRRPSATCGARSRASGTDDLAALADAARYRRHDDAGAPGARRAAAAVPRARRAPPTPPSSWAASTRTAARAWPARCAGTIATSTRPRRLVRRRGAGPQDGRGARVSRRRQPRATWPTNTSVASRAAATPAPRRRCGQGSVIARGAAGRRRGGRGRRLMSRRGLAATARADAATAAEGDPAATARRPGRGQRGAGPAARRADGRGLRRRGRRARARGRRARARWRSWRRPWRRPRWWRWWPAPSPASAELWVVDRVTGKTVVRRVNADRDRGRRASPRCCRCGPSSSCGRASSSWRSSPAADAVDAPPPPRPRSQRFATATAGRAGLDLGGRGGRRHDRRGTPSTVPWNVILSVARIEHAFGRRLCARVTLRGPRDLGARRHAGGLRRTSRRAILLAEVDRAVSPRPPPRADRCRSARARLRLAADSHEMAPYEAVSGARWAAAGDVGVGLRIPLRRRTIRAGRRGRTRSFAQPYPTVRFFGTSKCAQAGRPSLIGSVTLLGGI